MSAKALVLPNMDWLREIGIYGWPIAAQNALLTALVTGQPLLFVSRHGCAKTLLVATIAKLLGLNFAALDASKSNWEDLIGFVSPLGLADGKVDYVSSPMSLWNKQCILIDEISRSRPQTLNSYLELVRSRTLQGKRLEALQYVFAAMNPADSDQYSGTYTMDAALLSRFVFVVEAPSLSRMQEESILEIITSWNDEMDAPLLRRKNGERKPRVDLPGAISEARERFETTAKQEQELWGLYLRNLRHAMISQDRKVLHKLDGRTMASVHKAILARRALSGNGEFDPACHEEIGDLITQCFGLLRFENGGLAPYPFESAHLLAWEVTYGAAPSWKRNYSELRLQHLPLYLIPDEVQRYPEQLAETDLKNLIVRRLTLGLRHPPTPDEAAFALACLLRLLNMISPENGSESLWRHLCDMEQAYLTEHVAAVADLMEALSLDPDQLDEDEYLRLCLCYVAGRELSCRPNSGTFRYGSIRQFINYCKQVRQEPEKHIDEIEAMKGALHKALQSPKGKNKPILFTGDGVGDVSDEAGVAVSGDPDYEDLPF